MAKKQQRGKNKDNARRSKKKVSLLSQEGVRYVDYKDVALLRRFMSDRAKIRARRVTGNDAQQQREVARARGAPRAGGPPPRPTSATPPPPVGGVAPAEPGQEAPPPGEGDGVEVGMTAEAAPEPVAPEAAAPEAEAPEPAAASGDGDG